MYLLICSVILSACSDAQQAKEYVKYNKDTTATLTYYENDNIRDSIPLKNGIKHGIAYHYTEDGDLQSTLEYEEGILSGWQKEYYTNGSIKSKTLYINNKNFGSRFLYYADGSLKSYSCYDFRGNNRRVKMYDSSGSVTKNEGLVIGQAMMYNADSFDHYSADTPVEILVLVSTAPHERVRAWIIDDNGKKEYDIINNNIMYQQKLKPGNHKILTIGESIDTNTQQVLRDSLITTFVVD